MSDLQDLYQQMIVDHGRKPRNFGKPASHTHAAVGHNPLCGDRLTLFLSVDADDRVTAAHFDGRGCAISTASASLLTEAVVGLSKIEANALFDAVHRLVTEGHAADDADLGKLEVFAGVHEFPARVKCASLAWHTLMSALTSSDEPAIATTE